jgi:hypothetical protein
MLSQKRQKRMQVEELMERFRILYNDKANEWECWHRRNNDNGRKLNSRLATANAWLEQQFALTILNQANQNLDNQEDVSEREKDAGKREEDTTKKEKDADKEEEGISKQKKEGSSGPASDHDWNSTDEDNAAEENVRLYVDEYSDIESQGEWGSSDESETNGYEADDEIKSEDELSEFRSDEHLNSDTGKSYPFDPAAYTYRRRLMFRPLEKIARTSYPSFIECWMAYPSKGPITKFVIERHRRVEKAMDEQFDSVDEWIAKHNPVKLNANYDQTLHGKLENLRVQIHFLLRESLERGSDASEGEQIAASIPDKVKTKWNTVLDLVNRLYEIVLRMPPFKDNKQEIERLAALMNPLRSDIPHITRFARREFEVLRMTTHYLVMGGKTDVQSLLR